MSPSSDSASSSSWNARSSTHGRPGESSADRVQRYADFVVELVSRGIASDGEPTDDRRGTAVSRTPASARLGERKIPVEGPERRRKT
jgi:hypothetical protein